MENFTPKAREAIAASQKEAAALGHNYIGSEHILLGILSVTGSLGADIMLKYGIAYDNFKRALIGGSGVGTFIHSNEPVKTITAQKIIAKCKKMAEITGHDTIGTEHILMSILSTDNCVACKLVVLLGVRDLNAVFEEAKRSSTLGSVPGFDSQAGESYGKGFTGMEGGHEGHSVHGTKSGERKRKSNTPELDKYSKDFTALAHEGKIDPVIGRDKETDQVIQILSRRNKNTPCLIGEPGVGKTAIVEGLANRIAAGNVPETVKDMRIVSLDLASVLAGSKYRGEFEERLKNIMDEVVASDDIILFLDEVHTIVGAGESDGTLDAANILKPVLARGEFRFIGATTIKEYRKIIEKDSAFERRFSKVLVDEPTPEQAIEIIKGLCPTYEKHHKVKITEKAIESSVFLSARYITDRFLPDKAIDLIDETAARIRLQGSTAPAEISTLESRLASLRAEKEAAIIGEEFEKASEISREEKKITGELEELRAQWSAKVSDAQRTVSEEDIADTVAARTGIPVNKLEGEEQSKLLGLEAELKNRVIGQDEAVEVVSRAVRRGRTGLKDPKRPQGSFLFCGPTGVGKTELSKALADSVYGDEKAIIRIDMSEYMEPHSVSKLIGSPPGYVGYNEAGQLTEKVRTKPYSVILFDEVEKAHPDVLNLLLQVLDDGILTDGQGRTVDFKNTIIIMTSNLGSSNVSEARSLGFSAEAEAKSQADKTKEIVNKALREHFRPEFLNRIDEIVIFNKLSRENIKSITKIMLSTVVSRIESLGINISFTDSVFTLLSEVGFDPVYGARPLRRAIQQKIEDSFSLALLEEKIKTGDTVLCDVDEAENIVYVSQKGNLDDNKAEAAADE